MYWQVCFDTCFSLQLEKIKDRTSLLVHEHISCQSPWPPCQSMSQQHYRSELPHLSPQLESVCEGFYSLLTSRSMCLVFTVMSIWPNICHVAMCIGLKSFLRMQAMLKMRRNGYLSSSLLPTLDCVTQVIFESPYKAPKMVKSWRRKLKLKRSNTLKYKSEGSAFFLRMKDNSLCTGCFSKCWKNGFV